MQFYNMIIEWLMAGGNGLLAAQVLASLVTAAATYALWRATKVLAVETTILAKRTAQPFVVCVFESSKAASEFLNITLRNTGNATAFDIEIVFDPMIDARLALDNATTPTPIKSSNFSLLPPGQSLSFATAKGPTLLDNKFSVTISWAATPNATDRETLTYQSSALDGFQMKFKEKNEHHIAQELEEIRKLLSAKR